MRGFAGRLTLDQCASTDFCGPDGTLADVPDKATNTFLAGLVEEQGLYRAYIGYVGIHQYHAITRQGRDAVR